MSFAAARVGFEPTEPFSSAAFKAAALVHYATSPSQDSLSAGPAIIEWGGRSGAFSEVGGAGTAPFRTQADSVTGWSHARCECDHPGRAREPDHQ